MRTWNLMLLLVLAVGILSGCGSQDTATSGEGQTSSSQVLEANADVTTYTSVVLGTGYEGALPASSQLALGTLELEGTENAVAPEQAKTLLPLWKVIQGGTLQSDAETNAVLKQIEKAMTAEQLAAITAMQLTMQNLGTWMQEQGVDLAPPSGAAGGSGGFAPPNGMSEDEMAALRATAGAGGGFPARGGSPPGGGEAPGGGPFGDMSEEERVSMRATAEASGMTFPGGGGQGGPGGFRQGQLIVLAEQVVELLTELLGD